MNVPRSIREYESQWGMLERNWVARNGISWKAYSCIKDYIDGLPGVHWVEFASTAKGPGLLISMESQNDDTCRKITELLNDMGPYQISVLSRARVERPEPHARLLRGRMMA